MEQKKIFLTGYHGTKKYSQKNIEKNGFIKSLGGWLGGGIYFFQDDYELAISWAKKKHNTIMTCFIKKAICVNEDKFFDITWPLSKQSKYFFKEREKYVKNMEKKGYKVEVDSKKRFEGAVIDLICDKKEYQVARACTYTYQQFDEVYKLDSIFANGVEICVKNDSCLNKGED